MSVGQRDPLVEYRRQAQIIFDEMQAELRAQVIRTLFHAQPVDASELERPIETELTRAARQAISNADRIVDADAEFEAADFDATSSKAEATKKPVATDARKKAHKAERQRKSKARKRK
jgi:preprotein translocase subunit SecA